ncbi:MAG: class I SAM-dependent methyltransferase, partial [Acidimicrobiales bacterium]|nr:class I SAM-dependent methyltransferase [Acidimicrobiales bacterium]
AGKGQAVLIAARLPYRRVIGIEVDEELAAAASQNLKSARSRLRAPVVEVITEDAQEWRLPDDASVVFLYCPFVGRLFHRVLQGVFESHDRRPRALFLVYCFPFEHNWLISTGRVQVEYVQPARWPTIPGWWKTSWVIVTYRLIGPGNPDQPLVQHRTSRSRAAAHYWGGHNDHRFWVGEPDGEKVYSGAWRPSLEGEVPGHGGGAGSTTRPVDRSPDGGP